MIETATGTTRLLLITGLPGSGKTTLARLLARRWAAPLIAKDRIKEPLLDVLGAQSSAASRALSDASFAVMFALARELLLNRTSVLLEGNFRPGEHDPTVRDLLSEASAECAQILCRIDEPERLRRLAARGADPRRHPGHRDAALVREPAARGDEPLVVPGECFSFEGTGEPGWPPLLERLERWWSR